ncbi:hypothetical protein OOT46_03745 [Aquabacterium sp. A7-Y]|uniref:hypothetical protein n=1 Tax=Aquabacterium sp. A7-Y TaxID=1349605 RepID=UPI00223D0883|nr:hypothetical protein [Aquabacterium sp. A7-Y]MCW7536966.1 hypothetical protein [Aquabacterium sp. A7-Y]
MQYEDVVAQWCEQVGIADPAPVLAGGSFFVHRLPFGFLHDPQAAPDLVIVRADCGPIASDSGAAAWTRLLQENFVHFMSGASLGIAPENGHLIYAETVKLDEHALERLAERVLAMSRRVLQLRPKPAGPASARDARLGRLCVVPG